MADQVISVSCGFFDSIENDRAYSAEDMNKPYSHFISDGVFATPTGTVVSATNNIINILSGPNVTIQNPIDDRVRGLNIYGKSLSPTKYRIRIKTESAAEYTILADNITENEYLITGLTNGQKYNICIDAFINNQWYENAFVITAAPQTIMENVPVVRATVQGNTAILSWDAVENATEYYIGLINEDNSFSDVLFTPSAGPHYISGLEYGKQYRYGVQAKINSRWYPNGSVAKARCVYITPKPADSYAPANISVTQYSLQLNVEWLWHNANITDPIVTITTDGNTVNSLSFIGVTLRGIPTSDSQDSTYVDERGQAWISDEIDCAEGIYINRLDENLQPISPPIINYFTAQMINNFTKFRTRYGANAFVQNDKGAFMNVSFTKAIIAEQTIDDLSITNDLKVFSSTGMKIIVSPGRGLFAQKWFENPTSISITVPPNTTAYSRCDSVIIQVDQRTSGRSGNIVYRTGAAKRIPQPPEINTLPDVTEYRLANIYVAAGATIITDAVITDLRGTSECPWATSQLYQGNLQTLTSQLLDAQASVTDLKSDITIVQNNITDIQTNINELQEDVSDAEYDIYSIQNKIADTGWSALSLASWSAGDPTPRIRAIGKVVNIVGQIIGNSLGRITTLEEQYRPLYGFSFIARMILSKTNVSDAEGLAIINIDADGIMEVDNFIVLDSSSTGPYTSYKIRIDTVFTAQ